MDFGRTSKRRVRIWPHCSAARSRCSGAVAGHPSSSWIRRRRTSDAVGSPCVTKVIRGGLRKLPSQRRSSSASACAESIGRFLTCAWIGMYCPWIFDRLRASHHGGARGCRPPGTLREQDRAAIRDVTTKDVASVKGHWAVQEDRHVDDAPRRLEPLQVIEQRLGTADREGRDDHRTPALSCALNDMTKRVLRITGVCADGRHRSNSITR